MAKQTINLGTMADNKSGDPLRTAFTKINDNFDELYAQPSGSLTVSDGTGTTIQNVNEILINATLTDVDDGVVGISIPEGNANTGNVTFNDVEIIGAERPEIGHFFYISSNYTGEGGGLNGNGLFINRDISGLNQIAQGDIVTFHNGSTGVVAASYDQPQQGFWVVSLVNNVVISDPNGVWPLSIASPNYRSWMPPALVLKADGTAGYGLEIFNSIDNDTHIKPVDRTKGAALGFAYGQGSHVRVEGSNSQWGNVGEGDKVGIVASDGNGTSAEWLLTKDGVITLPNGGTIGPEGMGWAGFSNGTTETPVTLVYKTNTGSWQAAISFFGGNDVDGLGSIQIYTRNAATDTNYQWSFNQNGAITLPKGGSLTEVDAQTITSGGMIIQIADLAGATVGWGSPTINADNIVTGGWDYVSFSNQTWYEYLWNLLGGNQGGVAVTWAAGSQEINSNVFVQFTDPNTYTFQFVPSNDGGGSPIAGTWYFPLNIGATVTEISAGFEQVINNNTWKYGNDGSTTLPGAVIKSTVTNSNNGSNIDLTKAIHKLTQNDYNLADGIEGQVIHLVPQPNVSDVGAIWVQVANARHGTNTWTGAWLAPFRQTLSGDYQDIIDSSLCTLIFTDGAWQQTGGLWD
jgi:hypothetical protein